MTEPCTRFAEDCVREEGSCAWIFGRLRVWPLIDGGSRVEWTLHPQFNDAGTYTYQLQVGRTGNANADDWVNVGLSATDVCSLTDATKRVYGKKQWTHYRIVLTTPQGTYTSDPEPATGVFNKADYLMVREIERRETLRLRQQAGTSGYLLKRRLFGTACTCRDTMTNEVRDSSCPDCYGTGFVGGYFPPAVSWAEQKAPPSRNHLDDTRGTVDDSLRTSLRMLDSPQLFSYDVWVARDTDYRWILHAIRPVVAVRGRPVVVECEARLAPFTHPIYKLEIDGQVPS